MKDKTVNPNQREDNTNIKESAINKKATEGKEINPQEVERKEQHQPRDKA